MANTRRPDGPPEEPNAKRFKSWHMKDAVNYIIKARKWLRQHILGTLEEIVQRSNECPFCKLIIGSLDDSPGMGDNASRPRGAQCVLTWQPDGREAGSSQSEHGSSWILRTRRIRIHWGDQALYDSYIVLMAPGIYRRVHADPMNPWPVEALFLGREISTTGENQALIRGWIDSCRQHHGLSCQSEPDHRQLAGRTLSKSFFGVVDVQEMRLTSLPPGERFVALSYTWGSGRRYRTTLQNVRMHKAYGGIAKAFPQLPLVIQDTIRMLPGLGERYLWIDSLCIVQDSEKSWKLNASVMDLIYGSATFTVCAADGEDASAGLVGLKPAKRNVRQHAKELDIGLRLMVSNVAETYIKSSRWNKRGWTFQERLLSRRCVIFTAGRVYYQCRAASLSEDIIAEQVHPGWSIELTQAPLQILRELRSRPFKVYMECVPMYTCRNLHDPQDILAAFMGIGNILAKELMSPLIFGLPTSHFDLALLWEPTCESQRRKLPDQNKFGEPEKASFPSWSWCGWEGSSMEYRKQMISGCLTNINLWLRDHTWISWYIRDGDGDLGPIWNGPCQNADNSAQHEGWRGYARVIPANPEEYIDSYGRKLPSEHRKSKGLSFERTLPEYPYHVLVKSPSAEDESSVNGTSFEQYPKQRYLQFWTWSAYLFLRRRAPTHDSNAQQVGLGLERFDIADNKGDWCGTIRLNSRWARDRSSRLRQEFIAISDAKDFSEDENPVWTYYIAKEKEEAEWDLYYVLLISSENGIAQRVGLGKVFKEAFNNSCAPGKKWKEIVLE